MYYWCSTGVVINVVQGISPITADWKIKFNSDLQRRFYEKVQCPGLEWERCQKALNPYLRHFGNVRERHLWTKNPQSHFWFWWRHTSIKIFYFMLIWNLLSSTNCTPLGLITWRHYPEISCDEHKCTRKPGNMVERHLWTKNPLLFFTRKIFAELF